MSFYDENFSAEFGHLRPTPANIGLLLEQDEFLLVSGDFFGIQKFIFEGLSTKNASKVLRAKSAYIQIFTKTVAYMICDALGIERKQILSSNAGKFEILSQVSNMEKIEVVQRQIDDFFIERFCGLSGVGISATECRKTDFDDPKTYRLLRERLAEKVESRKFKKFDLHKREALMDYDKGIDNTSLCRLCNIRKKQNDRCEVCDTFVRLGEMLAKKSVVSFTKGNGDINLIGDYYITFAVQANAIEVFDISKEPTGEHMPWALSSYVKNNDGLIETFENLADNSCKSYPNGIKALGVLKADVDGMGDYIRNSDVASSYEAFDIFSKSIDAFFSIHVPKLMREKYPDTYTVFAGGDDLFLIGAWDEVLDLAREIESDFKRFVKEKLSVSMGIIVTKPSTPISFLAEVSEGALESAKEVDGKDAISLFGECVKFKDYREAKKLYVALKEADNDIFALPTAFLYRLLELLRMRQNIDKDLMNNSMWKSKLSYSFRRNVFECLSDHDKKEKAEELLGLINHMIDQHPSESKMVLSEFIYKRRKAA